jgi:hypothetical protein
MGSNPGLLCKISTSGAILATYTVGARLSSLTFDGVSLWGTFDQTNQAVEINPSTGAVLNTYGTGAQPKASVFDGHKPVRCQLVRRLNHRNPREIVEGASAALPPRSGLVLAGAGLFSLSSQ